MPELKLNKDLFLKYMQKKEMSIPEMAQEMNINRTYLHKVLKDNKSPGRKFIEGTLRVLPYKFEEIFLSKVCTKKNKNRGSV